MYSNKFQVVLIAFVVLAVTRHTRADNPLAKAREEAKIKEEVKQAVEEWWEADRADASNTRNRTAESLRETEGAIAKLTPTLARWNDDVRPLLKNDAGRRIAFDPALRLGFLNAYAELNPNYDTALAECFAAKQFVESVRKFLEELEKNEKAYAPSVALRRRIDGIGEKLAAWQQRFGPAVAKTELWLEITTGKSMHELTLGEILTKRGIDRRTAELIGKDQIALRQSAYELTAPQFAATLKSETGVRRGTEFVESLRAMSGKFVSRRNRPELAVTIKVNERTRNAFTGKMYLNIGDETCDVTGRFDGSTFLCEIERSVGRMTLKGTVKDDAVSGEWSIGRGNDLGTFRFDLSRDETVGRPAKSAP